MQIAALKFILKMRRLELVQSELRDSMLSYLDPFVNYNDDPDEPIAPFLDYPAADAEFQRVLRASRRGIEDAGLDCGAHRAGRGTSSAI